MYLSEAAQRAAKRSMLEQLYDLHVADIEHDDAGAWGYRHSAKRSAWQHHGRLVLGSRRRGQNCQADMRGCRVDHPRIAATFDALADACNQLNVRAFDPKRPEEGGLRHAWAKTDAAQVMLSLVMGKNDIAPARRIAAALTSVEHIAWSVQDGRGNNMRGTTASMLTGSEGLRVELCGVPVEVAPQGFLQPNPAVAEMAYRALLNDERGQPWGGELAYDLYAGAGVTTALLRQNFARVHACDAHAESAGRQGVETRSAEDFLRLRADQATHVDLVVANPPRSGLGSTVCSQLRAISSDRLHVMSCNPASLARDLDQLCAIAHGDGNEGSDTPWRLESLRAFDTLPQTPHIELVAQLVRVRG